MLDDRGADALNADVRIFSPALLLAILSATLAAGLAWLPSTESMAQVARPLLAILAGACVFALFVAAAGLFRRRDRRLDLLCRFLDGEPAAMAAVDAVGRVLAANDAYRSLCRAADLPDLTRPERLTSGSADLARTAYLLAQAVREKRPLAADARLADPAGWRRVSVRPLAVSPRRPASLWTFADISEERGRFETALAERDRARALLEDAPVGFFRVRPDGTATDVNATLAGWLDLDPASLRSGGAPLGELVDSDAAARILAVAGAPGESATQEFDGALKRHGGGTLPARLILQSAFGADGRPLASSVVALRRDGADEPRVADADASGARFARLIEATPIAIASLSADGAVLRANAAFARLAPAASRPKGAARASIYAAVAERDRSALEGALSAARGRAESPPLDVALAGDGERSARFFLAAGEPGEDSVATVFALDTTEQRALQSNFAQSQKMQAIGQLAGGVAHDFNNVLTAIIGFSDLLLGNHRPTDPSFRDIMQIKQNAIRAAGLVRQLLAFSRRQTLRPQVLQIGDVLSDLQMMMRRLVGEKIRLDLRHGRDLWPVKADLNQFEQVIVNLIVNSRDAMPDGGEILIKTRNVAADDCAAFDEKSLTPGDYVAIEVEDGGHGVPAEVRDKIFEPFFTTKEVGKGTGLGLATVYGIVRQTGGFIFCSSPPGGGATFSVLLPRHVADAPSSPSPAEPVSKVADLTGRGTILLVEDEEAVRAFAARALASRGYSVLQAGSGVEALEIVDRNPGRIDLVVSDVVMPEMDGPTMFGELRKRGVTAKVIFVSGYAEEAFARNLPEGQDFAFLPKPFSLRQLIETVKGTTPAAP